MNAYKIIKKSQIIARNKEIFWKIKNVLTVVRTITNFPFLATTADVQFELQECEQELPKFAFWDAST